MYCKNCGTEIDDKAVMCPNCGKKLKGEYKGFIITLVSIFLATTIICISIFFAVPKLMTPSAQMVDNDLVQENLLTVEFTIPAEFFIDGTPSTTLTEEQKAGGYKSMIVNSDGSVTYTMKKSSWKQMVSEYKTNVVNSLNEIIESGDYSSLKSIQYNDTFSQVTVTVNKSQYESSLDSVSLLGIYMNIVFYQSFTQGSVGCVITVKDASTGTVIDTQTYPKSS